MKYNETLLEIYAKDSSDASQGYQGISSLHLCCKNIEASRQKWNVHR